jgi:hypothetical protein
MSNNDLQLAKQAIGNILKELKIAQVVYVDDVFEEKQDIAQIIGWFAEAYRKSPAETSSLVPDVSFGAPDEVWRQELSNHWNRLNSNSQREIIVQLLRMRSDQLSEDFDAANKMKSLFPKKANFVELSPSLWEQQRDTILDRASAKARVLCLFDQDLSESEGFTRSGARSGIGLIQDVIGRNAGIGVICGLVTHTIPSLENEMAEWRRLSEEHKLKLSQFLPLAKIRLADDTSPLLFADGIKKTVLNIFCEELKNSATEILQESHISAVNQLLELDVYDFDHMVLQAAFYEGEWEADTLIRLFHIFQRDSIRTSMLDPKRSASFNKTVEAARPISAINTMGDKQPSYPWNVSRIRRSELYEESSLIKHSPLQVGDIFELVTGGTVSSFLVLLAQPCDLMVRQNGIRDDGDNIIVPLVPIVKRISYDEAERKRSTYLRKQAFMRYFYPASNDVAVLRFPDAQWASIDVLDLAVLNKEGFCRLNLEEESPLPPQFTVGWKIRIANLVEKFEARRNRLDELRNSIDAIEDENSRKILWQSVMPRIVLTNYEHPLEPYSNSVFDFGLRRIGRYRQPGANRLLKAYTRYLSRDAEEHDFARPIK